MSHQYLDTALMAKFCYHTCSCISFFFWIMKTTEHSSLNPFPLRAQWNRWHFLFAWSFPYNSFGASNLKVIFRMSYKWKSNVFSVSSWVLKASPRIIYVFLGLCGSVGYVPSLILRGKGSAWALWKQQWWLDNPPSNPAFIGRLVFLSKSFF